MAEDTVTQVVELRLTTEQLATYQSIARAADVTVEIAIRVIAASLLEKAGLSANKIEIFKTED